MGLTKYKIGDLITPIDERNRDGSITVFCGININKEFMPTVANTDEVNPKNYKIVRKNRFVFSGMQTGRDECIRIGLYTEDNPVVVSPAYTTFEIVDTCIILAEYLYMFFLRKEMDRYGWFLSDSSIRANLDWDRFCEIEINLPSLPIQQKYVDVYNAMVANQRVYERGLDDLKKTCDVFIEQLRREMPHISIREFVELCEERNINLEYGIESVKGVSIKKQFIETKADMNGVSLKPYLLVEPEAFAFVTVTSRNGERISLAHNNFDDTYLCSSSYVVFRVAEKSILIPSYLWIFFNRSEFDRYARFHSWGSAREVFSWQEMQNVKIPIPSINVQRAIVNIYNAYSVRREMNEQLKALTKEICPILIKGSLEEACYE